MNKFFLLPALIFTCSCSQQPAASRASAQPNAKLAQTEKKEGYKPGLGEIMSGVQMHHAKLWFAGINLNWKLAGYEINEIKEALETAKEIETDRPEVSNISMIYGDLDRVSMAIQQQDAEAFKNRFRALTNTCNACHRTVNFGFNVITIPSSPPVSNQDFKAK